MRMKEFYEARGMKASWEYESHSATEGHPRYGVIRKVMKVPADWRGEKKSLVGVTINTEDDTIKVEWLAWCDPKMSNLFWALLADRDVRRMIKKYQKRGRKELYKMWSTSGISGREDVFISYGKEVGGFNVKKTMKLCHISCEGKLNEGFGDKESKMYVGDFVELCVYLGLTDDMDVKNLRKKAKVKYIRPKFVEELEEYSTSVSTLL